MAVGMEIITFDKLPRPRNVYNFSTAEELVTAAERAFLRVQAAKLAGNLACSTEIRTVRTKKLAVASWSSDKAPRVHFQLTDLRDHDGWLALMLAQQQRNRAYGVRTYLFSDSGETVGVALLKDSLIKRNLPNTYTEMELFVSEMFVGSNFTNPPLAGDALAISSALNLVPVTPGGSRRSTTG
jgi:hypothetical protein